MPPLAALTGTVRVHEPLAGIEPPVKVTVELVDVAVPPQVLLAGPEVTTPLGRVSVSGAVRLATVASGLLKVMVSVEVPPAAIVAGQNALPSVGGSGVTGVTAHAVIATVFESSVTEPFRASARPETRALVLSVMLASARIFPMNVVPVPIVAELPTCQKTLHCCAPLMTFTVQLAAVTSVRMS